MNGGYFCSPWPAEDGGPARLQIPCEGPELALQPGELLGCTTRHARLSTMTVLGAPGEVFVLTQSALRVRLGFAATACVERIDPITLKTLSRSPRLPGGPLWPGGLAVHRNGHLVVVYGRYAHLLRRDCTPIASFQLPINGAYSAFVVLENGLLVTKNLSDTTAAHLTVLDPDTLRPVCGNAISPEPSIAGLSAIGNTVYVVGVKSIFRYHWSDVLLRLEFDPGWRFDYTHQTKQTYGWDVVLDGRNAWFMDNGKRGGGVSKTSSRLIRVSLADCADINVRTISGLPTGSVTNPPLYDLERNIVVAYDSANAYLAAWHFEPASHGFTLLWVKKNFACASHMLLYPKTGQLLVNDNSDGCEEVVLLNIDTGTEIGRIRSGGSTEGAVFPGAGWNRDVYWSSRGRLVRLFVRD